MANLFVIYLPIENVSEEANNNIPSELSKAHEPNFDIPRVGSANRFRAVASSSDIVRLSPNKQPNNEQQRSQQMQTSGGYEDGESQSEVKPLLDNPADNWTSSNAAIPKSASSNVLLLQPTEKDRQMTGSGTADGTLSKSSFREVPGSRFKISAAAVTSDDLKNNGSNRRGSLVPDNMLVSNDAEITKEEITLKEFLEEKLAGLDILNHVWQKTMEESFWMVSFMVTHDQCDKVFNSLCLSGFGRIPGTSLSIFPTSVHEQVVMSKEEDAQIKTRSAEKSEFLKSIKSSLTVAQVVGAISSGASLTFDFLLLIVLASMIAALGLAENSSVVLVASMLISPLMGPIIGFTFGIVIKNKELCKLSVRTELIGLCMCVIFGFIFGIITGMVEWSANGVWPTSEMQARGMLRSLWVGILIALPSGAGVALAILGGNTGSLVGVAISASLLPPLVNAGTLWGLALVTYIHEPTMIYTNVNSTFEGPVGYPPNCPSMLGNDYKFVYSCTMSSEAAVLGSVSLLLAILNIICIFLMGTIVMKIKELSPLPGATKGTVSFWKKDVAVMRNAYETIKGSKSLDMGRMARDFIAAIKENNPEMNVDNVIADIRNDPSFNEVIEQLPNKPQNLLREISMENRERLEVRQKSYQRSREVICGDQLYHTISGNIAPFRTAMTNLFEKNNSCRVVEGGPMSLSEVGSVDTSQSEGPALVSSSGSGSQTHGGCILRIRKPHHHHDNQQDQRAMSHVGIADESDEDEVLMVNYDKLKPRISHAPKKQRSTSIACVGHQSKSPTSTQQSPTSKTPIKSPDVRIKFNNEDDITFI